MRWNHVSFALAAGAVLLGSASSQAPVPLEPLGDDPSWSDVGPLWSTDGERIVFSSNRSGNPEVYEVRPDGSGLVQLTNVGRSTHSTDVSADGGEMLLESDASGDREIYVLAANGSAMRRLTHNDGQDRHAQWMPGNERVVFDSDRDGNIDVYSMDHDGGDLRRLTSTPGADLTPIPSPDGTRIVFGSDRTGDRELFIMSADGGEPVQLTHSPDFDGWPRWSPDGERIAFTSRRDGGDSETYVINADGTGTRRLTETPGLDYMQDWSPDGGQLVIRSNTGGRAGLEILDLATGSRQRITNTGLSHFARVARDDGVEVALQRLAASPGGPLYFQYSEILHYSLPAHGTDPEVMARVLEQGVAAYPERSGQMVRLGDLYLTLGRKSESVAILERAVRLAADGADLALLRARAD